MQLSGTSRRIGGLLLACVLAQMAWVAPAAAKGKARKPAPVKAAPASPSEDDQGESEAARQALGLARFHYKKEEYAKAAALFMQAYSIQQNVFFLFNAARAEQRAMNLDAAEKHFKACLDTAGAPDKVLSRSRLHLAEIESVRAALAKARAEEERKNAAKLAQAQKAAQTAAAALKQKNEEPVDAWKTPAGWAAVGVGGALLGVGGWLALSYAADQEALNEKTHITNDDGKVIGIDFETYDGEQARLNDRAFWRSTLLVTGAAVAGAGAWMLLTAPEQRSSLRLVPAGGRSLALVWDF